MERKQTHASVTTKANTDRGVQRRPVRLVFSALSIVNFWQF
jgi:hypothetical protein